MMTSAQYRAEPAPCPRPTPGSADFADWLRYGARWCRVADAVNYRDDPEVLAQGEGRRQRRQRAAEEADAVEGAEEAEERRRRKAEAVRCDCYWCHPRAPQPPPRRRAPDDPGTRRLIAAGPRAGHSITEGSALVTAGGVGW